MRQIRKWLKIIRQWWLPVLVIVFTLTVILITAPVNLSDYARITEQDYTAEIVDDAEGDNGKVLITERLTFDVHARSKKNTFKELWRDLPETNNYGVRVSYKVLSVKQLSIDGTNYQEYIEVRPPHFAGDDVPGTWEHKKAPDDDDGKYACVSFNVDIYREKVVFEIQYEMYNASRRYEDCSELYLALFSGKDVKHLESVKGKILVPNNKMPDSGNYDAHTYGTKAYEFKFTESKTLFPGYHAFIFGLNKSQLKFGTGSSYIEFALVSHGADKHKFTQFASLDKFDEAYNYKQIQKNQSEYEKLSSTAKNKKIAMCVTLSAAAAFVVIIPFLADIVLKKRFGFTKSIKRDEHYKEIPAPVDPVFTSEFAFCKHEASRNVADGYAAAMLGLIQKGYIETNLIDERKGWKRKNIVLSLHENVTQKGSANTSFLKQTKSEQLLLALIKKHSINDAIELAKLNRCIAKDYKNTRAFENEINGVVLTNGVHGKYFRISSYEAIKINSIGYGIVLLILCAIALVLNLVIVPTRLDFAFGALFILGAGFGISSLLIFVFSRKYVLLTQYGEDEYKKWRGLYNFLNSETLINERTVQEVAIWEAYLIYATAFGISGKVISALAIRYPEYDISNSRIIGHPYFCSSASINSFSSSFSRSAQSTKSTGGSYGSSGSSGGSGGGYGGGGSGGGGGGGRH